MSNYEDIYGKRVKELSADPTLNSSYEGQVWYNSTEGVLKSLVEIKAWTSGGALNQTRGQLFGSGATRYSAIAAGGLNTGTLNNSEEYNGNNWTATPTLNTARRVAATGGPVDAAFAAGGFTPPNTNATEEYSGFSWSNGGNLGTARRAFAGAGSQTAGVVFGGYVSSPSTHTEEYNGSSWTAGGALVNSVFGNAGCGTQTAAFNFGGKGPSAVITETENYDGTTWATNSANIGAGRYSVASATGGTQTAALLFGGLPGGNGITTTEQYDGSSWSTVGSMANGRSYLAGAGISTGAIAAGGGNSPFLSATEEFNARGTNVVTPSSWANGGNMSSVRAQFGSANAGTQTSGLAFGGYVFQTSGNTDSSEEYGGSSWTSGGNLPSTIRQMGGSGTQTACLGFGGNPVPGPGTQSLSYDGSSWTSAPALNTGTIVGSGNGGGTSTSALRAGGNASGAHSTTVEEYDGSSWTSANAMSTSRKGGAVDGSQTAGIAATGESSPSPSGWATLATEHYDGTNWSAGGNVILQVDANGKSGGLSGQTALMICGGDGPADLGPATQVTQVYDGTAWSGASSLTTPRRQLNGGGTSTAGLVFGGSEASITSLNSTEEFTGAVETITAQTLTSS